MRKPDLAAAIAEKADLTKEQANRVLNAVLEEITGARHRKDSVTLVGFGTFLQRHRGARTGKNPQTAYSFTVTFKLANNTDELFAGSTIGTCELKEVPSDAKGIVSMAWDQVNNYPKLFEAVKKK